MKKQWSWLAALVAVFCLLSFTTACAEKEGPLEKAGETLDDAANDAGDALEDAADDVEDAVDGDGH